MRTVRDGSMIAPISCGNLIRRSRGRSLQRKKQRKAKLNGKMKLGIKRVREEMAEISEDQKFIREGQRQVRERYEANEEKREQLWKETEQIAKQSASVQMRLALMFQLLKARAQNDIALVAQLTLSLRDSMLKPKEQEKP